LSYKDEQRGWRRTFTRDNREGAARLRQDLSRLGPEGVARAHKRAFLDNAASEALSQGSNLERLMNDSMGSPVFDTGTVYVPKERSGLKERTIYLSDHKVIQKFDGMGNIEDEQVISY